MIPNNLNDYKGMPANDIQVLNTKDGLELFSGQFENWAKKNNKSFVIVMFPKGNPDSAMYDDTNCDQIEAMKALKAIANDDIEAGGGFGMECMTESQIRDIIDECVDAGLLERNVDYDTEEVHYKPTKLGLDIAGDNAQ